MVLREAVLLLVGCCCSCYHCLETSLPMGLHGKRECQALYGRALPCWGSRGPGWDHTWPPLSVEHTWSPAAGWGSTSWRGGGRAWWQHQGRSEESSHCSSTRQKKKRYLFLSLTLFEPYWPLQLYQILQVVSQLGKCSWHCHNTHTKKAG